MKDIICALFQMRDVAHKLHLSTKSFAAHLALGDFYTGVIEHADALAEMYQGQYGLLDLQNALTPSFDSSTPVSFIHSVAEWATQVPVKLEFSEHDTHLLNKWDEVISLIYTTKYKLENLS